ncbi:MAG: DUF2079 domain-containing protein [Acidimicrobiia bacterium]|nr:DUF2079 domain-containing protein [Acidimicrobiia bacterium]
MQPQLFSEPLVSRVRNAVRTAPARVREHWVFGEDRRVGVVCVAVTAVLILWYTLHFGHLTSEVHRGYGDSAFDIGLYDQGLWLLSRFHAPFITLMGRNLFGDHTQFSLLFLVPLYWLRPDATTLLYVQAFALALGAVPVYLLAMRLLRRPVLAVVLAASYLLFPALAASNLENFHPDCLLVPILGFAIYAAMADKRRMFIVFAVLALLSKEDAVFVVLPLAVWFALRRDRRIGAIIGATAIGWALFATNVIMRSLIGVPTLNTWRVPFGGPSGVIKETLRKPADVVKYLIKADHPNGRPFYLWQMVAPTGLVFLVAPEVAATAFLVVALNILSTFGYQHQIAYHYSMAAIPGLMLGTVFAIGSLKKERARTIAVWIVALSALWTSFLWAPFPWSVHNTVPHLSPSNSAVLAVKRVQDKLPPRAVVSVYYGYASHVDHRRRVYMWPTPFAAANWKTFKQEGQLLPEARDVEYLFLPTNLEDHAGVFARVKSQFHEVARAQNNQGQGAVLYKRNEGG